MVRENSGRTGLTILLFWANDPMSLTDEMTELDASSSLCRPSSLTFSLDSIIWSSSFNLWLSTDAAAIFDFAREFVRLVKVSCCSLDETLRLKNSWLPL